MCVCVIDDCRMCAVCVQDAATFDGCLGVGGCVCGERVTERERGCVEVVYGVVVRLPAWILHNCSSKVYD